MSIPQEFMILQQNIKAKDELTSIVNVELTWHKAVFDHALARKQSNYNTNVLTANYEEIGVLGELAFQILTGIPMDWRIGVRDPYDFKVRDLMIDVKSTHNGKHLSIKRNRFFNDPKYYYVLCQANIYTFHCVFLGWIEGSKVPLNIDQKYQYSDLGVYKGDLHSMGSLRRILAKQNSLNGAGVWND